MRFRLLWACCAHSPKMIGCAYDSNASCHFGSLQSTTWDELRLLYAISDFLLAIWPVIPGMWRPCLVSSWSCGQRVNESAGQGCHQDSQFLSFLPIFTSSTPKIRQSIIAAWCVGCESHPDRRNTCGTSQPSHPHPTACPYTLEPICSSPWPSVSTCLHF